jgi:hypothetical protein
MEDDHVETIYLRHSSDNVIDALCPDSTKSDYYPTITGLLLYEFQVLGAALRSLPKISKIYIWYNGIL